MQVLLDISALALTNNSRYKVTLTLIMAMQGVAIHSINDGYGWTFEKDKEKSRFDAVNPSYWCQLSQPNKKNIHTYWGKVITSCEYTTENHTSIGYLYRVSIVIQSSDRNSPSFTTS